MRTFLYTKTRYNHSTYVQWDWEFQGKGWISWMVQRYNDDIVRLSHTCTCRHQHTNLDEKGQAEPACQHLIIVSTVLLLNFSYNSRDPH